MSDLEERLRDEFRREAQSYDPSPDLPDRIATRIGRRTQRTQILAAAAVSVAVLGIAAGVVATRNDGGRESIVIDTPNEEETATTEHPSTTTTQSLPTTTTIPPDQTTTTTPEQYNEMGPVLYDEMPLNRHGVWHIYAGKQRIIDAAIVGHIGIGIDAQIWEDFGSSCGVFTMATEKMKFVAWTKDHVPNDDPGQAIIRAIGGSDPAIHTEEGIHPGSTLDEVLATYGQPTRTFDPSDWVGGDDVLVYDDAYGYAYAFRMGDDVVVEVMAGHIETPWEVFEPCA
jgi:hypothetical protein